MTALSVDDLRSCLEGTVYDIEMTRNPHHLSMLVDRARRIKQRCDAICETYGPIASKLSQDHRIYQTHHSVRLELQGPETIEETESIVRGLPADLAELYNRFIQHALKKDLHLVEVAGAYGAELLAEAIAGDLDTSRPFFETDLRQLNQIVLAYSGSSGTYRTDDFVGIGEGYDRNDPLWFSRDAQRKVEVSWVDIPREMSELCDYVSRPSRCPPLSAAITHAWFTRVHPFRDGNGRVARLLANLVLVRNGWPPVVIRYTDREDYLDALEESDAAGDIRQFFELIVRSLDLNLEEYSNPEIFDQSYRAELSGQPHTRLDAWINGARTLIDELRLQLHDHGIYIERVSMPAQSTFLLLENREGRAATLLAKIRGARGQDIRVGVGYMSQEMRDGCYIAHLPVGLDDDHAAPTIYFQERAPTEYAYPYVRREQSAVRPLEISFPFADPMNCIARLSSTTVQRKRVDEVAHLLSKSVLEILQRST